MKYERYKTLKDMAIRVNELLEVAGTRLDYGIYPEQFSFRPQVIVYNHCDDEVILLRWYAYTEEDIDFYRRTEASAKAREIVSDILAAS